MNSSIRSVGEIFESSVERYPDKRALKKGLTEYNYAQLKAEVIKLRNHLRSLGLTHGERFAVTGENRPEWAISYLSVLRANLVVVPIDPLLSEGELLHILRESGARGVFASEGQLDRIESIRHELKQLKWVIPMNSIRGLQVTKTYADEKTDPNALAALIFTSGTTGTSKAVMLSHQNLLSNLDSISTAIPVFENDTFVSIIPMHHTFEGTCGFLYPLHCGASIYYPPSLKPNDLIATLKEAKASCLIAVPLLFEKLLAGVHRKVASSPLTTKMVFATISGVGSVFSFLRKPLFARVRKEMGLGNLRLTVSGGAAIPEKVTRGLELLGLPLLQGYGLTESAPVLTANPAKKPKNASVGIPLANVEIKISDPDAQGIGEIIARGPNIMMGYYNNKKATEEVIKDGWLYTGDLGYIDAEGYVYITGRKKSLIVTQTGKNIYPEELEELLVKSDLIKEALVIPRIDPRTRKEEVCALIFPNYELLEEYSISKGVSLSQEEVQSIFKEEVRKVNDGLPIYKKITQFEIREEEFPKTTTQKIKRHMFVDRGIRV